MRGKKDRADSRLRKTEIAAVIGVALLLGGAAVPIAANAADINYWSGALGENVHKSTNPDPKSLVGGGGWAVGQVRFWVNIAAGAGYSLGSAYADGGSRIDLNLPRYSPAYANCWWDLLNQTTSTTIGTTCFYKN